MINNPRLVEELSEELLINSLLLISYLQCCRISYWTTEISAGHFVKYH